MIIAHPAIELRTSQETDRIALRGVRLKARLSGLSVKATLEQTFVNLESHAIEAIYTFPLPETAAVCGFEVVTGDHVLTAKVEESDAAIQQYDEAISGGHGAYLLEQDRPDVFTARVGNLKPGQAATIRITYVAPLERSDRSIRVRFPTTIAPRFVSASGTADPLQAVMDGDALNPPHVLHVPYGMEMQVQVQLGQDVKQISSPTHAIQVDRPTPANELSEDSSWKVNLADSLTQMDRDIVLQIDLARETSPQVQVARGPDDAHYLAVTFLPEFDENTLGEHRTSETVFLVDCSGSMQGESIQQATAALELCLRSLSTGDTFNICRFGSTYDLFAPSPVVYSAATLNQALAFIRGGADLGGTEIFEPLQKILAATPAQGSIRSVIILTDGQVSNEPAVIDLASKWRSTNRLFTFGIGSAASGYLVKSLARTTGGAAEFVSGNERIEDKVLRTFSRISSPMVTDLAVRWGEVEVQTPAEISPVFDGDPLRIFARAPGKLPENVTLQCRTPAGPQSWSVKVPAATNDDGVIALAWARTMIQSLEESAGQTTTRVKRQSSADRRLVTLSKQFGILCSRTSFIAVEHRTFEQRNAGSPELRRIPVQLAHGWHGVGVMACASMAAPASGGIFARFAKRMSAGLAKRRIGEIMSAPVEDASRESADSILRESDDFLLSPASEMMETSSAPQQTSPTNNLLRLLALQTADGWFDDGYREVLQDTSHEFAELEIHVTAEFGKVLHAADAVLRRRFLATVIVLSAFSRSFADRRSSWRRAEAKARRWLKQAASLDDTTLDRLLEKANQIPPTATV